MPPKHKHPKQIAARTTEATGALIKQGQKGVIKDSDTKDAQKKLRSSTQRALALREAIMGKGEIRISGREKLELLAEDSMKTSTRVKMENLTAVRGPFKLVNLLKLAQSMMDASIDRVNGLHDVELCFAIAEQHIRSQTPDDANSNPYKDKTNVASQFGFCVHNSYMLASGWTLVYEFLRELKNLKIQDKQIISQMKSRPEIRILYMLAYDMVKNLIDIGRARLLSIARNTKHFAKYFRDVADLKDGSMQFDDAVLRDMYKSFLDSTIIELCLPGSAFSPAALYQCLHDVEEEAFKETKRCSQAMWDAVGDLGVAVNLMDSLETPLLAPEGREWIKEYEELDEPKEYYQWKEAQDPSIRASQCVHKLQDLLSPISNLKSMTTLNKVWVEINSNYKKECGLGIDELWQVDLVRKRIPHWTYNWAELAPVAEDSEEEENNTSPRPKKGKKALRITAGGDNGYESSGSMPGLLDVSDSDDNDDDDDDLSDYEDSSSEDENDDDYGTDTTDEFNEEDEDEMRRMYRTAMNIAAESPDEFLKDTGPTDKWAKERKTNPFLKLLGSLRGRMFQKDSALRTDGKTTKAASTAPQKAKSAAKSGKKSSASNALVVDDMPPLEPLTRNMKKATIEDVEEDSDEGKADKKKKKKKPKKKKKKTAATDDVAEEDEDEKEDTAHVPEPAPPPSPAPKEKKKPSPSIPIVSSGKAPSIASTATIFGGSTYSLPEQRAGSAKSYLASLTERREKVKTRPDQVGEETEEKRSLFTKLGFRSKETKEKGENKKSERTQNVFVGLKKKSKLCAQKLFGLAVEDRKGSLKWESFVQMMKDMGFDYDPSTAGSSVRFDPPNKNDRAIHFHKPHPDPTLHQNHLKEFRKKLIDYYDWSPEQLKVMDMQFGGQSAEVD